MIDLDHVTLLELLLSLIHHQIKTAILITIHLQLKNKKRLRRFNYQGTTVSLRFVLYTLLCVMF